MPSVSLADLQTMLSDRLERSPFWTQDELRKLLNESLRMWNVLTGTWKKRVVLQTRSFSPYYSLAGYLTFGMTVWFNSRPLAPSTVHAWDKGFPYWEGRPGPSPEEWAPIGISLIAIRPADNVGSNALTIDGVASTPILVNTNDKVDIGQETLNALLQEAQYLAAFKEGGAEFQAAIQLHQSFLRQAAVKNEKLLASARFRKAMGLDAEQAGQRPRRVKPSDGQTVGMR